MRCLLLLGLLLALVSSKCTEHEVTTSSLNIREKPAIDSRIVQTVSNGEQVCVVKKSDGWAQLEDGNYCSAKYLKEIQANSSTTELNKTSNTEETKETEDESEPSNGRREVPSLQENDQKKSTDYLAKTSAAAKVVYKKVLDLKCKHRGGASSWNQMVKKHVTTCASSVSISLQQAGVLPEGKLVSHTARCGANGSKLMQRKNSPSKAIIGKNNLIKGTFKLYRVGKLYKDLSGPLKRAGVVYIYDSNIAISAGNKKIYTCNNGSSQLDSQKRYIRNIASSGYCFTHTIIYAIVPNSS